VREDIDAMLARCGGAASRDLLLRQGLTRQALDREIRSGALVRVYPRAYCRPWDADSVETRERAALFSVGMPAGLSHVSALRRWGLVPTVPDADVYVCVPATRCPRRHEGLIVHRVHRFPPVVRLHGVVTVAAPTAIATSWPMLTGPDRRGPAIAAVRDRLVTPDELRAALTRLSRLAGRRELSALTELLAAGCESELEIWGLIGVFDVPGLDHAVRQKVVRVDGRRYRIDLAYEHERVAVELDGDRFHSSREQRERDRRRDAALASVGWLTLRYSHSRLHKDVSGCRRDTLATLAARSPTR